MIVLFLSFISYCLSESSEAHRADVGVTIEDVTITNSQPSSNTWLQDISSGTLETSSSECSSYNSFRVKTWGNTISSIIVNAGLTSHTCSNPTVATEIVQHWKIGRRWSGRCGQISWQVASCGSGIEICADCSEACTCSTGVSIRPCTGNENWGGESSTCKSKTTTLKIEINHSNFASVEFQGSSMSLNIENVHIGCVSEWKAIETKLCPKDAHLLPECHQNMHDGHLCEADMILPDGGEFDVNNCGKFDVFRSVCAENNSERRRLGGTPGMYPSSSVTGDSCSQAVNLAYFTSPHTMSTLSSDGAKNHYTTECGGNGNERIAKILVPSMWTLTIWQKHNDYDSRHQLKHGGNCPGENLVRCIDDPDYEQIIWYNNMFTSEWAYFMVDAYDSDSGTVTVEWSLTSASGPSTNPTVGPAQTYSYMTTAATGYCPAYCETMTTSWYSKCESEDCGPCSHCDSLCWRATQICPGDNLCFGACTGGVTSICEHGMDSLFESNQCACNDGSQPCYMQGDCSCHDDPCNDVFYDTRDGLCWSTCWVEGSRQPCQDGLIHAHCFIADCSFNDRSGAMHGEAVGDLTCQVGEGIILNGQSYLELNSVSFGGPFSIAIWHYRTFDSGQYHRLLTFANTETGGGCCTQKTDYFIIRSYSSTDPYEYQFPGSDYTNWSGDVHTDEWYLYTVTSENGVWKAYLNDMEVDTNQEPELPDMVRNIMRMGASGSSEKLFWEGGIASMQIWDRALSASEVQELVNLGRYHCNGQTIVGPTFFPSNPWPSFQPGTPYDMPQLVVTRFYMDGVTNDNFPAVRGNLLDYFHEELMIDRQYIHISMPGFTGITTLCFDGFDLDRDAEFYEKYDALTMVNCGAYNDYCAMDIEKCGGNLESTKQYLTDGGCCRMTRRELQTQEIIVEVEAERSAAENVVGYFRSSDLTTHVNQNIADDDLIMGVNLVSASNPGLGTVHPSTSPTFQSACLMDKGVHDCYHDNRDWCCECEPNFQNVCADSCAAMKPWDMTGPAYIPPPICSLNPEVYCGHNPPSISPTESSCVWERFIVKSGPCEIRGDCIASPNQPQNYLSSNDGGACDIVFTKASYVTPVHEWEVEQGYDILSINDDGNQIDIQNLPSQFQFGSALTWRPDASNEMSGWVMCFQDEHFVFPTVHPTVFVEPLMPGMGIQDTTTTTLNPYLSVQTPGRLYADGYCGGGTSVAKGKVGILNLIECISVCTSDYGYDYASAHWEMNGCFCDVACSCWHPAMGMSESWIFDDGPTGGFQPVEICPGMNDCIAAETFPSLPEWESFMEGVCTCNDFYWEVAGSLYNLEATPEIISLFPGDVNLELTDYDAGVGFIGVDLSNYNVFKFVEGNDCGATADPKEFAVPGGYARRFESVVRSHDGYTDDLTCVDDDEMAVNRALGYGSAMSRTMTTCKDALFAAAYEFDIDKNDLAMFQGPCSILGDVCCRTCSDGRMDSFWFARALVQFQNDVDMTAHLCIAQTAGHPWIYTGHSLFIPARDSAFLFSQIGISFNISSDTLHEGNPTSQIQINSTFSNQLPPRYLSPFRDMTTDEFVAIRFKVVLYPDWTFYDGCRVDIAPHYMNFMDGNSLILGQSDSVTITAGNNLKMELNQTNYIFIEVQSSTHKNLNGAVVHISDILFIDNDPFIVDDSLRLQGMDWGDHVLGAQFEAESLAFQAYGASTDVQYVQVQYGPAATAYNALGLMIQNRRTIIFDTELATSENDCYSPNVCTFTVTVQSYINLDSYVDFSPTFTFSYPEISDNLPVIQSALGQGCDGTAYDCPTDGIFNDAPALVAISGVNFWNWTNHDQHGAACGSTQEATNRAQEMADRGLEAEAQFFWQCDPDIRVTIGGKDCGNVNVTGTKKTGVQYVTCEFGAGTGTPLPIIVSSFGKSNGAETYIESFARNIFGFAAPSLTNVTGCSSPSGPLHTTLCPRYGGISLTMSGVNFGQAGARIFVGGKECENPTHDFGDPHGIVYCDLQSGVDLGTAVLFLQSGGQTSSVRGEVSYVQCQTGFRQISLDGGDETLDCIACEQGKISTIENSLICVDCAAGKYAPNTGMNECVDCPAGKATAQTGSIECTSCAAGTISNAGSSVCTECGIGTLSKPGSSICTPCPKGTTTSETGANRCELCAPGTFASSVASQECSTCPNAGVTANYGSGACKTCPVNSNNNLLFSDYTYRGCVNLTNYSNFTLHDVEEIESCPEICFQNHYPFYGILYQPAYYETFVEEYNATKCNFTLPAISARCPEGSTCHFFSASPFAESRTCPQVCKKAHLGYQATYVNENGTCATQTNNIRGQAYDVEGEGLGCLCVEDTTYLNLHQCWCGNDDVGKFCPMYPENCGFIQGDDQCGYEFRGPIAPPGGTERYYSNSSEYMSLYVRNPSCKCDYGFYGYFVLTYDVVRGVVYGNEIAEAIENQNMNSIKNHVADGFTWTYRNENYTVGDADDESGIGTESFSSLLETLYEERGLRTVTCGGWWVQGSTIYEELSWTQGDFVLEYSWSFAVLQLKTIYVTEGRWQEISPLSANAGFNYRGCMDVSTMRNHSQWNVTEVWTPFVNVTEMANCEDTCWMHRFKYFGVLNENDVLTCHCTDVLDIICPAWPEDCDQAEEVNSCFYDLSLTSQLMVPTASGRMAVFVSNYIDLNYPLCTPQKAPGQFLAETDGHMINDTVWPAAGYMPMMNMPAGEEGYMRCLLDAACAGGPPSRRWGYCEFGYKGVICSTCEKDPLLTESEHGFGLKGSFQCEMCPEPFINVLRLGGSVVVGVIFLIAFIYNTIAGIRSEMEAREQGVALKKTSDFTVIGKIFFSYIQFNSLATKFEYNYPSSVEKVLTMQELPATVVKGFMNVDCFVADSDDTTVVSMSTMPTIFVTATMFMVCPFIIGVGCSICFLPYVFAKKPEFNYPFDVRSNLKFSKLTELSKMTLPRDSYAFKYVRAWNTFITSFVMIMV